MYAATPPPLDRSLVERWWRDEPTRGRALDALRIGAADRDLRGISLAGEDLSDIDLTGYDLSGADLKGANLSRARLLGAKLVGTTLRGATLDEAELAGADLRGADLSECSAVRTGFGHADLSKASLFRASAPGATFTDARLCDADLRTGRFDGAAFRGADLRRFDAGRAALDGADLEGARVEGATLDGATVVGSRLNHVRGYESASWLEIEINRANLSGAHLLRRFVLDQNYLHEFRSRGRAAAALHWVWWITSDCGRSVVRWATWTLIITVAYALAYTVVEIDYGRHVTDLSPLYFSIVTITTLGYGDVLPASLGAQLVVMSQVIVGYLMLGGLLSLFAGMMGRRA